VRIPIARQTLSAQKCFRLDAGFSETASALIQGLADGYFIIPYTIGDYLATARFKPVDSTHPAFRQAEQEVDSTIRKLLSASGGRPVDELHRELGNVMWEYCGMARNAEGLKKALELIRGMLLVELTGIEPVTS